MRTLGLSRSRIRSARAILPALALIAAIAVALPHSATAVQTTASYTPDAGISATIEGLVRDVACPMQNHSSTATHFNMKCAMACARSGSPLIILTRSDEIYFPITDQMPDRNVRDQLVPYVGKFVDVTGTVFVRNGTRAIVIKNIHILKDVRLDPNLGDD